jgi:hypothetical protein
MSEGGAVMLRTILDHGINWNWYLNATFNEDNKTVIIHCWGRWHKYDNPIHPVAETISHLRLIESAQRTVVAVVVDGVRYAVLNPQYIGSYNDMSHLTMEGK